MGEARLTFFANIARNVERRENSYTIFHHDKESQNCMTNSKNISSKFAMSDIINNTFIIQPIQ